MRIKNRNKHDKTFKVKQKIKEIKKDIADFLKTIYPKPEIKITCNEDNNPKDSNKLVVNIEVPSYLLLNNEV
jgi:hypothetical protein